MRKRIIAIPTIMLSIGAFFVYLGLELYFFPRVRGQFLVGAAFAMFGTLIIVIAGITLILLIVTSKPKKMRSPTSRRATKKREWIIALATIALDMIVFYIGSFFLYWGAWNHLIRGGTRPWGLDYLMLIFGGSMTIIGIIVVLKLVAYLSPKRRLTQGKSHLETEENPDRHR